MQPALKMITSQNMEHPKELLIELEKSAAKWYQGGKSVDVGAKLYFDMNMVERRVIERIFPTSIFITFNSSDMRVLFPNKLPVFYMYSMKKGVGVKPWFQ
jgi:L-tyrosine isonitrile synthase